MQILSLRDKVFSHKLEQLDEYESLMLEPTEALTKSQEKEIERIFKNSRKYEVTAAAPVYQ